MSRRKKLFTIAILVFAAVSMLMWVENREYNRNYRALQALLKTDQHPVDFMQKQLKPGMSQAEVNDILRGYARIEHLQDAPEDSGKPANGPTDCYVFDYGLTRGRINALYDRRLCVTYNPDATVQKAYYDWSE